MQEFKFSDHIMREIREQALAEYPSECCGWVIEDAKGEQTYSPSTNLQDKYHKLDPQSYPRTSKDAFLMDVLKLSRAIEETEKEGGKLFSIVHSHIDVGAYFSAEDRKQMATPEGDSAIYPAHCYLVVAVKPETVDGEAVFHFDEMAADFIEGKVVIG